jgi:hypothetical protein
VKKATIKPTSTTAAVIKNFFFSHLLSDIAFILKKAVPLMGPSRITGLQPLPLV